MTSVEILIQRAVYIKKKKNFEIKTKAVID